MIVNEFIKAKIDIGLLTETWLKDTPEDQAWVNQSNLTQSDFILQQHNWQSNRKGGGIGLLYHKNIDATLVEAGHTCTTEYTLWKTILQNKPLYIMGIYHPPPCNDTTNAMFIDEITELLAGRMAKYNSMVILGDLNMHIDDLSNADSYIFSDTMYAFSFKQQVTSPAQKCSHILDLVYIEVNSELNLYNCKLHEFISDCALVTIDTTLNKTPWEPTENVIRDTTSLAKEILEKFYIALVIDRNASLKQACDQFNEKLHKMLDRAAPPERYDIQTGKKNMVQQVYPWTEENC